MQRASLGRARGSWGTSIDAVNNLIIDLVQPTNEVARVIGAVANGDLSQTMGLEIDGRPLTGEFLRTAKTVNTMVDQLNGFASEVTRVAREVGTDGKLGGQAQVPRGLGDVEGPHRQRQLHGEQPDQPGAQHRRGDDGRGQRRPVEEDHRRRARRDPRAEGHDQHDGRPAQRRSPRRSPGWRARSAPTASSAARRRSGRLGDLEGPHRQRQLDGRQPHRPGAQHRRRHDGRGQRRPVEEDHRRRRGRDPRAEEDDQHDGRPAQRRSPRR